MVTNPGTPAFGLGTPASKSWSLPGGRTSSTSGSSSQSSSSTQTYDFRSNNPITFYDNVTRYVAYNHGTSTKLSVTVSTTTSSFFTNKTVSVNIPLFEQAAAKYTLSYDALGGSPTPSSQSLESGATFTAGAAPTKSGYVFGGWSGSNGQTYAAGSTGTMPSSALKLTAIWSGGDISNLAVDAIAQETITIKWDAISGVSQYNLYLNEDKISTTSAATYTFRNLTPGTLYSLGVAVNSAGGVGTIARVSATTVAPDPSYPANAKYAIAKIGTFYSSSVTATNGTSYELVYGNLPPGLTLSSNGTISGTPRQREDGSYYNETDGYLDSFTFGIKAIGVEGSSPIIQQFIINTVFPGVRQVSESASRNFIIAKRWNGEKWVPVQGAKKWDGNDWTTVAT